LRGGEKVDWKGLLASVGLWIVRVLIREGKKELAKRVLDDVVADPKVPEIKTALDLIPPFGNRSGIIGFQGRG
jgi:hypothetical protein